MRLRSAFPTPALGLSLALVLTAAACGSSTSTDAGPTTTASVAGSSTSPAVVTTAGTTPGTSPPTTAPTTATTASTTTTKKDTKATSPGPSTSTTATTAATTTIPGTDPGTLPQTEDKPAPEGDQWDTNTAGLWNAIVADDPDQARPFFFPLSAYRQVKAISNIDGDYQNRLIAYYEDDIHKLHKQLGDAAGDAKFVKIDVPASAQWIKPGVEYNKGAYWRVFDSKLVYEVGGKQKTMLVKSMISWRGQWYVVHLSSVR